MNRSKQSLEVAISQTTLKGREIVDLPILNTAEVAYAIEISAQEVESAWRSARSVFDSTGLWPIASTTWCSGYNKNFKETLLEDDIFSRFGYCDPSNSLDVSPRALCTRADCVDLERFLIDSVEKNLSLDGVSIEYELEEVAERCGEAPTFSQLTAARVDGVSITTRPLLERWLKAWEDDRGFSSHPEDSRQSWFESTNDVNFLIFLPIESGWDALAYLNYFGAESYGTEYLIALGRFWEKKFGAELVAHFGTMLQCLLKYPPKSFAEAWPLALEHYLMAECTLSLSGINLRDYAHALIGWERWFLHQRP